MDLNIIIYIEKYDNTLVFASGNYRVNYLLIHCSFLVNSFIHILGGN